MNENILACNIMFLCEFLIVAKLFIVALLDNATINHYPLNHRQQAIQPKRKNIMALLNHKAIIATAYAAMTAVQISDMFKGAHAVAKLGMVKGAGYRANFAKALKDAHKRFQRGALNAAYKKLNVRISGNTYNHLKTIKSQADVKFNGANKTWEGKISFDGYEYITKYCYGVTIVIMGALPVIDKNAPCPKCGSWCYGDCEAN